MYRYFFNFYFLYYQWKPSIKTLKGLRNNTLFQLWAFLSVFSRNACTCLIMPPAELWQICHFVRRR